MESKEMDKRQLIKMHCIDNVDLLAIKWRTFIQYIIKYKMERKEMYQVAECNDLHFLALLQVRGNDVETSLSLITL